MLAVTSRALEIFFFAGHVELLHGHDGEFELNAQSGEQGRSAQTDRSLIHIALHRIGY